MPSTTGTFWLTLSLGRGNRVRLGPDLLVPSSLALSRCPPGTSARAPKPRTGRLVFTASRRQAAVTQVPQASGLNGEHEVRGQRAGSAGRSPGRAAPGHRARGAVVLHLRRAATSSVAGYEGANPSRAPPPGPQQPPQPRLLTPPRGGFSRGLGGTRRSARHPTRVLDGQVPQGHRDRKATRPAVCFRARATSDGIPSLSRIPQCSRAWKRSLVGSAEERD